MPFDFATASQADAKKYVSEQLAAETVGTRKDGSLGWTLRGLLAIYANQTAAEQAAHVTKEDNGIGFNGTDAKFLSDMAKNVLAWQAGKSTYHYPLSVKQWAATQKAMRKYAGQLARIAQSKAKPAAEPAAA